MKKLFLLCVLVGVLLTGCEQAGGGYQIEKDYSESPKLYLVEKSPDAKADFFLNTSAEGVEYGDLIRFVDHEYGNVCYLWYFHVDSKMVCIDQNAAH